MKRSRSVKRSTIYVQTTMKKRKTGKSLLVTGAGAGTPEMKEEHIVVESELAASSTLSEEEGTTMTKLIKSMAPLCSIYDVDFRTFAEEHELSLERI